jgi:hypothetical protein
MADFAANPPANDANTPSGCSLAPQWRILITAVLLAHLIALVAAPLAVPFGDAPPSQLQRGLVQMVSPYLCLAYLDHGYRFFAPAPSAGHLVRYQLEMPDGTTSTGVFPNLKTQWPRLYYHRFFMLSEKLNRYWDPEEPAPTDPPEERRFWQLNRDTFLDVAQSYASELLRQTGARKVTLELVQHELPSPRDLEQSRSLTDPAFYKTLWTKTYEAPQS